jgi:hypothetical protein
MLDTASSFYFLLFTLFLVLSTGRTSFVLYQEPTELMRSFSCAANISRSLSQFWISELIFSLIIHYILHGPASKVVEIGSYFHSKSGEYSIKMSPFILK